MITNLKINADGTFSGVSNGGYAFVSNFPLYIIHQAWTRGLDLEALADGYGAGMGTHGDWSGIRDSSPEAIERMLEAALNDLFGTNA